MKDLTKGYPAKVIILFAIPLALGNILQMLYNMVDTKIVSTYVDTNALAAVGATAVVTNVLVGFLNGLTQGFSILVARSFGARDEKRMRQYVAGNIKLTLMTAVLLTAVGFLVIEPVLHLLQTPEDIFSSALSYVRIIFVGIIFTAIYNLCANVLRAVGDSKTPLYCLMASVGINTGLDLLFVAVFHWGIGGAAAATVIAQGICAFLCAGYVLWKFHGILPKKGEWKLNRQQYASLITTGLSMGLMGFIVNIGTVVLQGAMNTLGTKIVAAHTAGRRVFDIIMVVIYTIGFSMTTYVSQNMGAGKYDRIRQGVRHALVIVSIETSLIIAGTYLFSHPVIAWIANSTDPVVVGNGVMYMKVGVWFFYVLGPLFILRCTLQGMGRKIIPVCSSFLEMIMKILSAAFLVPALGYFGVALTEPFSWVVMTIPLIIAYLLVISKLDPKHTTSAASRK